MLSKCFISFVYLPTVVLRTGCYLLGGHVFCDNQRSDSSVGSLFSVQSRRHWMTGKTEVSL